MNIVYMFAEQLRRQSCGYAGDGLVMPACDRAMAECPCVTRSSAYDHLYFEAYCERLSGAECDG